MGKNTPKLLVPAPLEEKKEKPKVTTSTLNPKKHPSPSAEPKHYALLQEALQHFLHLEGGSPLLQKLETCLRKPDLTQNETHKLLKACLLTLETLQELNWMCHNPLFAPPKPLEQKLRQELQTLSHERTLKRNLLVEDHSLQQQEVPLPKRTEKYNPLQILETNPEGKTYRVTINGFPQVIRTTWGDDPFAQGF